MRADEALRHAVVIPEIHHDHQTLLVSGDLIFETVATLRLQGDVLIEAEANLCFDFREVGRSDSSAVALLLAWLRKAKQLNKPMRFINLSLTMLEMVQAFDVKALLPIDSL